MQIETELQMAGCEQNGGPWRRGWADISRKMQIGSSIELPDEREMRSFIQTMRTCGFRSSVRKKQAGGYVVKKLGPSPKMVYVKTWKDGVEVRKQIPDPTASPVSVPVIFPVDSYKKLQMYCDTEGTTERKAILEIVEAALLRHERYASAV